MDSKSIGGHKVELVRVGHGDYEVTVNGTIIDSGSSSNMHYAFEAAVKTLEAVT